MFQPGDLTEYNALDSVSRVNTKLAKLKKVIAIGRYLDNGGNTGSCLAEDEVLYYTSDDFYVWMLYENLANAVAGGYQQAKSDAKVALAAATRLKAPAGKERPIYFACDQDSIALSAEQIISYGQGITEVLHDSGFTRGMYIDNHGANILRANELVDNIMTPSATGWGGGEKLDKPAQIQQLFNEDQPKTGYVLIGGNAYDADVINVGWAGIWNYKEVVQGKPKPQPEPLAQSYAITVPLLKLGDKGDAVENVQVLLRHDGFQIAPNGVYDTNMTAIVRSFRRKNKLGDGNHWDGACWQTILLKKS